MNTDQLFKFFARRTHVHINESNLVTVVTEIGTGRVITAKCLIVNFPFNLPPPVLPTHKCYTYKFRQLRGSSCIASHSTPLVLLN